MTAAVRTSAIVDGAARVFADAIDGKVAAAAITSSVLSAAPEVVPIADDLLEVGFPVVTVALGPWTSALQPGNERLTATLRGVIWRPEQPPGDNTVALYGDRDAIADAWLAHSKAYLTEASLQSAVLTGGPGITPRHLGDPEAPNKYLTLEVSIEVKCNRSVSPQPA